MHRRGRYVKTLSLASSRVQPSSRRRRAHSYPPANLSAWGERDRTIPIQHGRDAHAAIAGSRFETLPRAAHFPHLEDPEGPAAAIDRFLATTEPAPIDDADWGALVGTRAPRSRRTPTAA